MKEMVRRREGVRERRIMGVQGKRHHNSHKERNGFARSPQGQTEDHQTRMEEVVVSGEKRDSNIEGGRETRNGMEYPERGCGRARLTELKAGRMREREIESWVDGFGEGEIRLQQQVRVRLADPNSKSMTTTQTNTEGERERPTKRTERERVDGQTPRERSSGRRRDDE